ncbi:MAG: hypothetical protein Q8P72_00090, partial [Candidatus Roizmanbacteria bacterium]|nr:hypothetical protein [Candidatus Roizmanbacteria bacterium]
SMSLTQDDLSKIGNLIETKLEQKLNPISQDFDDRISSLESTMILLTRSVQKIDRIFDAKLKPLRKELHGIDQKLDAVIQLFDDDVTHLKKRTTQIEDHLGLPTP